MQKRKLYYVYTNTDCTEGRGREVIAHVCKYYSTAIRLARGIYVQGMDGPIKVVEVDYDPKTDRYFGEIIVNHGTEKDAKEDQLQNQYDAVLARARALGLTDSDIEFIKTFKKDLSTIPR